MDLDPQNKEARVLLKQAQIHQKEVDKNSADTFANMCKALGKGSKAEANPGGADDDNYS